MKNKTKEQLSEDLYPVNIGGKMWMPSTKDIENANKQIGFIKGYDARQPEIDALKEQITKWISVEDRLPDFNSDINLLVGGVTQCGFYLPAIKQFQMYKPSGSSMCFPTRWQPLPNPPKQTKP
jgi:hypothetical protein